MSYLYKRGKWFYFKRRAPSFLSEHYHGEFVQASLKTDSEKLAKERAIIFNNELEKIWADMYVSGDKLYSNKLSRAKNIARMHGFSYLTAEQIAESKTAEIIDRIEAVEHKIDKEPDIVEAVLGKLDDDGLRLSQALNRYFEFQQANLLNKSDAQVKKWKNPKVKAFENLQNLHGDILLKEVTRDHILALRQWWYQRIKEEDLSPESANKDFSHLRTILCFIRDDQGIDLNIENLFSRIRFANVKSKRPPMPTNFIRDQLLNINNLKGLHHEARLFLFAMVDTGARPSELLGLNAERGDICLDAEIPYISIRPEPNKALKTAQSEREIPLVGAALYAFQKLPNGFKHYYRKADLLSSNLNKYLREHNLLPTPEHSVYSLRHSFEDRLTSVEPPEKVQAALMGHKYSRPRYGDGPSLEQKKKWLDMICFSEEY